MLSACAGRLFRLSASLSAPRRATNRLQVGVRAPGRQSVVSGISAIFGEKDVHLGLSGLDCGNEYYRWSERKVTGSNVSEAKNPPISRNFTSWPTETGNGCLRNQSAKLQVTVLLMLAEPANLVAHSAHRAWQANCRTLGRGSWPPHAVRRCQSQCHYAADVRWGCDTKPAPN